jgi:acyl-CoA ligase (AMP-forming) (exosortase A-associated)
MALIHELLLDTATRTPGAVALRKGADVHSYDELAVAVSSFAAGLMEVGLHRAERVAVYLPKRFETVVAMFGAAAAGCAFVPLNSLLKEEQIGYILRDCNVRVLVTDAERIKQLVPALAHCPDLHTVVLVDEADPAPLEKVTAVPWRQFTSTSRRAAHRVIDTDMTSIFYTSGSTGKPKGVVLSHRNMSVGAQSVASYLANTPDDRLLAALPLSFDYGFSQLSTAFKVGASVTLIDYLFPRDVLRALARDAITGLAGVPPLWFQLAGLDWPDEATRSLRYITNSGGAMPRATLDALRARLPRAKVFLMYGLTEAFRSTYLPPEQVERRPDSIGKAIPHAEILVLRADGSPCAPDEPGELVHRGALVSLGYWNDRERTAERFKPYTAVDGLALPENAVWSGDQVRADAEGYLYFVGRKDDMIKTSGYRVSPTEVEEILYRTGHVAEAAAVGVPHATLGQAIVAVLVEARAGERANEEILAACRQHLPNYMVPLALRWRASLPRNPNGKIDRRSLAAEHKELFASP